MIVILITPLLVYALYKIYLSEDQISACKHKSKVRDRNFEMGSRFEDFVRFNYFGSNYQITHVTPGYKENCVQFNEDSYKPDLKFLDKGTREEFWVECKYRTYTHNKKEYQIISENQLRRHRSIKDSPVYIMLGIGGQPNKPLYLYKIPISRCKPVMTIGHLYHQFQINKMPASSGKNSINGKTAQSSRRHK